MKISSELKLVENSVDCIKKLADSMKGADIRVPILMDQIQELEQRVQFLREQMEKNNMVEDNI